MTTTQIVIFSLCCLLTSPSVYSKKCGFYWKLYNGVTPEDAFEAGKDINGKPFYVGLVRVYSTGDTVSGMIKPSTQIAYITVRNFAMNAKTGSKYEVKILCTKDKEGFQWYPTTSSTVHMITNRTLVPGGYAYPKNLYIGRVWHNGDYAMGKVFPNYDPGVPWFHLEGLYVPSWYLYAHYYSFEVLTYKCENELDVRVAESVNKPDVDKAIELIFAEQ